MAASTPPRDASQLTELALLSEHYWTDRRALLPVLGAYLPRFGDGSPLSGLPKEVLQHIARLAYRPRITPKFELPSNAAFREWYTPERQADLEYDFDDFTALHELLDGGDALSKPHGADLARVLRFSWDGDFQYIELSFFTWYGTFIWINGKELKFEMLDASDQWVPTCEHDGRQVNCVDVNANQPDGTPGIRHVRAWDGAWRHGEDSTKVSLLFDPSGTVHIAVNGVAGLTLPLDFDVEASGGRTIEIKLTDHDNSYDRNTTDRIWCHAHVPAALAALATRPVPLAQAGCALCEVCRTERAALPKIKGSALR